MPHHDEHPAAARRHERGRARAIVLAGAAVSIALLCWMALHLLGADESGLEAPAAPLAGARGDDTPGFQPSPELMAATRPVEPAPAEAPVIEVAAEAAPPVARELPHMRRGDNMKRMFVAPEAFAEKYADATVEELQAARAALVEELFKLQTEASTAFLDAGRGETTVKPRPEKLPDDLGPGEKSWGLIGTSRSDVLEDGQLRTQKGFLPWEENVALYDKQDEQIWLGGEIRRRGGTVQGISRSWTTPAPEGAGAK